jgi:hypothetical protein
MELYATKSLQIIEKKKQRKERKTNCNKIKRKTNENDFAV